MTARRTKLIKESMRKLKAKATPGPVGVVHHGISGLDGPWGSWWLVANRVDVAGEYGKHNRSHGRAEHDARYDAYLRNNALEIIEDLERGLPTDEQFAKFLKYLDGVVLVAAVHGMAGSEPDPDLIAVREWIAIAACEEKS